MFDGKATSFLNSQLRHSVIEIKDFFFKIHNPNRILVRLVLVVSEKKLMLMDR